MSSKKKKILYISNVNIEGDFLPGVVLKIKGQLKAFETNGFDTDILYSGNRGDLWLLQSNREKLRFTGSREVRNSNILVKLFSHLGMAWYGSIDFRECFNKIVKNEYDVIYLRFYIPGKGLISFLGKYKKANPRIQILLEYPTLNAATEFKKRDLVTRVYYYLNHRRIEKLHLLTDGIITLTKDKTLFGKPAIFMGNGIDMSGIEPVPVPGVQDTITILGVASDCTFYHGFDKMLKGLAAYEATRGKKIKVAFRLITNPMGRNVDNLKAMAQELGINDIVSFEIPLSREELAKEYRNVHLGLGTLAMHRIGMKDNYSLKHREYAAFGLPFIMSHGDENFENTPFVMAVEQNDDPLDIGKIVEFYMDLRKQYPAFPADFRRFVEDRITWNAQMKNVFEIINRA